MDALRQDLRQAASALRRTPAFTLVAVLMLALGIGAGSAIFTVVNGVLLRPLPLPDAERLMLIWTHTAETPQSWLSLPEVEDLREHGTTFAALAALRDASFNVTGEGEPEQVAALAVSANLFPALRVQPALGRAFLPEEDQPGGERVVLLGHGFWQRRFGGDSGVVGRTLELDGESHTVVGVLPPDFRILPPSPVFPRDVGIWVPLERVLTASYLRARDVRHLHAIGRLRDDATPAQARGEVERIAAQLREEHPAAYGAPGWGMSAVPFQEQIVRAVRPALLVLLGAVALLLLIVCANLANLLLARGTVRARELAIRATLGASRARLFRQLFAESLLLALLGGAGGLLIALLSVDLLRALGPASLPRLDEISVDGRVIGFGIALALLTSVLFGVMPARQAAARAADGALREGGRSATRGPHASRTRRLLVVGEVTLAVVLLVGTGLMVKSFLRLQQVASGFAPEKVLTLRLSLPPARFPGGAERAAFLAEAVSNIAALPGVQAAGAVTQLPLSGAQLGSSFTPDESGPAGADRSLPADLRGIAPEYFRAMGIPLLRGRSFSESDAAGAPRVAVVDETLAARLWPGEDPVGQRLRWVRDPDHPLEVVGVVAAVKHNGPAAEVRETVYRPYAQYATMSTLYLTVRATGDPLALAGAVRAEIRRLDPDQPVSDVRSMEERVRESLGEPRLHSLLLGLFGGVALLLAALGLYGVISYGVAQRTREIGIRLALGAQRTELLRRVLTEGMTVALAGLLLGAAGALAATRLLRRLLFEVSPTDPLTFGGALALLAGVALLASYLPAQRAARIDPMVALRQE